MVRRRPPDGMRRRGAGPPLFVERYKGADDAASTTAKGAPGRRVGRDKPGVPRSSRGGRTIPMAGNDRARFGVFLGLGVALGAGLAALYAIADFVMTWLSR